MVSLPMRGLSTPRYVQLANTLYSEIQAGRYPVGSLLPTEHALCEQFGVSRFTVREAIKLLVSQSMVTRQVGVGTRVEATVPTTQYVQTMSGISDLSQYAVETTLSVSSTKRDPIDEATANMLGAAVGETWLRIEGLRFAQAQGLPMAHTEVYLAPRFRSLVLPSAPLSRPIYSYIEEQYGATVARVTQDIRAVVLSDSVSKALEVPGLSAGLWLRRGYFDERGELLELATNIHPSDRFTYRETFRRDSLVGAKR